MQEANNVAVNEQSAEFEPDLERKYELTHPYACFKSTRFYQYLFMMFAANIFSGFFSYQYKIIGNSHGGNDLILSAAASAAGLVQFVTRLCVGALYDHHGFKKIFYVLMSINAFNALFCYQVRDI